MQLLKARINKAIKDKIQVKINVKWSTFNSYHSCVHGVLTGYGPDGRGWIPGRGMSLLHNVQTDSGAHPAS
jgi:hypothetical protein